MASNINIIIAAQNESSSTFKAVRNDVQQLAKDVETSGTALNQMKNFGGKAFTALALGAAAATLAVGTGFVGVTKYAFDATREVQGYVAGIKGLTKNSEEASGVIKGMIDYVQGKPFDRIDTLGAARKLLAYGRTAAEVKSDIELLGRAVIVSGGSFEEISTIYGRVMTSGRLMTMEFDMMQDRGVALGQVLTKRLGISMLDLRKRIEEGKVSAEDFRSAMEEAVPASIVEKSANTVDNKLMSMKTSFRNLGFEILGVDFSQIENGGMPLVKPGGLLDMIVMGMGRVTDALRDPKIQSGMATLGQGLATVASGTMSVVGGVISWIGQNPQLASGLASGAAAFVAFGLAVRGVATAITLMGAVTTALGGPLTWVLGAVGLVASAYVGLQVASSGTSSSTDRLKQANDSLKGALQGVKLATDDLRGAELGREQAGLRVERATRTLADAVRTYGANSLEAREAAANLKNAEHDLAGANDRVRDATNKKKDAESDAAKKRKDVEDAERAKQRAIDGVNGSIGSQLSSLKDLKLRLSDLNGKNFSYTVTGNEVASKNAAAGYKMGEWAAKGHALGTLYAPGGRTLVGEHGPEMVNLPQGSQVTQAYRTRSMMQEGGGDGGTTNILSGTFNFANAEASNAFWDRIDKTQRLARMGMAS